MEELELETAETAQQGEDQSNLELVLVTTSMNHEYVKQEYERTKSFHRRQELLNRMSHLKTLYFGARDSLLKRDPSRVQEIEEDLQLQKRTVFPDALI